MYGDAVQGFIILILAGLAGMAILVSLPPLITGMACGIKMQGLTVWRGLQFGLWTAGGVAVVTIEGILLIGEDWFTTTPITGLPVLVCSIGVPIWLCRRESRRRIAGLGEGHTP